MFVARKFDARISFRCVGRRLLNVWGGRNEGVQNRLAVRSSWDRRTVPRAPRDREEVIGVLERKPVHEAGFQRLPSVLRNGVPVQHEITVCRDARQESQGARVLDANQLSLPTPAQTLWRILDPVPTG